MIYGRGRPTVELNEMPATQRKIEDLRDLLASIEDNGEIVPGEAARIRAQLAALERP